MRDIDIVIPVYDGLEETRRCLDTALATTDPAWSRLVLVNDASPNPAITALLRELAEVHPERIVLLENPENLGFVGTANRGMRHDPARDVLLLNSDVEVANNWLWRIREAAERHPDAASITPFANNATIFSFPNFCKDNTLPFGTDLATIDEVFAESFTAAEVYDVPTGVGCCMYLRREALQAVGDFDEATFGRGYGEENDWCQRAIRAGWRNLHLANCFVFHKGGVSFAEEQSPRIARAMELLDQRYPRYHSDIQAYVAADPARAARTRALLGLFARASRPKVLFISHKLGGGAQQHVDELARLYRDQALFLQLTPEREGESVVLSVFEGGQRLLDGLHFVVDRDFETLVTLLRTLGVGHLHFHHTMGVHPRLWVLEEALGCGHDLTVHDYYLVNGNPTLTDADARYVDESAADFDRRCADHYPLPEGVTPEGWREGQSLLVHRAQRVIFPSTDSAERFQRYFTLANPVVAWHPDYQASQPYPEPRWRWDGSRPLRVLVAGAISREKGAEVLEAVALALRGCKIEFHLLGYAYRALDRCVITHGPYAAEDAWHLIEEIDPDVMWYPALWPETYSYTLSLALHLGLPVVVPDIGAFVERVAGREHSAILPWDTPVSGWQEIWQGVLSRRALPAQVLPDSAPQPPARQDFYRGDYLSPVTPRGGELSETLWQQLADNLRPGLPVLGRRERWLGRLWRLSRHPWVARLVALVPFRVQQWIKRCLSRRPMHEIVR